MSRFAPRPSPRFIGRCEACGHTRTVDGAAAEAPSYMGRPDRDVTVIRIMAGGQPVNIKGMTPPYDGSYVYVRKGAFTAPCRCGGRMTYRAVRGVHDASVKCDARCWGAKGPSCTCECGGRHHGAAFANRQRTRRR